MLHTDPLPERVGIAAWIEAEHRDRPLVGNAIAFDALHGGRLAGAVRTYQSEDLALEHLERHVVDGHRAAVTLTEVGDGDDRGHEESYQRATYFASSRTSEGTPHDDEPMTSLSRKARIAG